MRRCVGGSVSTDSLIHSRLDATKAYCAAHVDFFAQDGTYLDNKLTLETAISNATGISLDVLCGRPLAKYTIRESLTWAIGRIGLPSNRIEFLKVRFAHFESDLIKSSIRANF